MNRQDQVALESRVAKLEAENIGLRTENGALADQLRILGADLAVLKEAVLTSARSDAAPAVEKRGPGRPRKWG